MILTPKHFTGRFEKIAQSITEITQSSSSGLKSSSGSRSGSLLGPYKTRGSSLNLQSTLTKSRQKADLQPLHKDTNTIYKPADAPFGSKMRNKQEHLGHIEDKRITFHHLRGK